MTTVSWLLPSFGEDTSRSASQLKVIFAIARRASCLSYRTNKPVALNGRQERKICDGFQGGKLMSRFPMG